MKRLLLLTLSALCALLLPACSHVGANGLTTVLTDFDQLAYERGADGSTRLAAAGMSTSKPLDALGKTATTLGMQKMLTSIAGGFFKTSRNEINQLEGTKRHLASEATKERLAEIEATRAAEEAALEAAAPAAALP